MSAVIVSVGGEASRNKSVDRIGVPPDMFTHSVRDLDDAASPPLTVPPGARNGQSIGADELKLD
jgi:hypothetical protein